MRTKQPGTRGSSTKARFIFVTADLQKGFGDWIMSLAAVKLTRDKWGDAAELVAVTPEPLVDLVEWVGLFDRIYAYRGDWCESLGHELDGATLVVALCDSDMVVYEDVARRLARYRINTRLLRNRFWRVRQHHALMIARNLDCIGVDAAEPLAHPMTSWSSIEANAQRIALHANCGPLWQPKTKQWPHFGELAATLGALGFQVVQVLGPEEPELGGVPTFRGSTLELAFFLLSCGGMVGNDSGPAHLAGALGVPTHVLFGYTDPELWHPLGPRVSWSRAESRAIDDISVAQVVEVVKNELYPRAMGD